MSIEIDCPEVFCCDGRFPYQFINGESIDWRTCQTCKGTTKITVYTEADLKQADAMTMRMIAKQALKDGE